jgi:hypothetical protein
MIAAKQREMLAALPSLAAKLDRYSAELGESDRRILHLLRTAGRLTSAPYSDETAITEHGATLDWLATQVNTPFFITLDSDVEFLERGWLTEMLELMLRERAVALGVYEAGDDGYASRLAPHLLMLRTAELRCLRASFRGFTRFGSVTEARRWASRTASLTIDREERQRDYPTSRFYSTAAAIFERILETGCKWCELPTTIARKVRHWGQMSWAAGTRDYMLAVPPTMRTSHAVRQEAIRARLRAYELSAT